MRIGAAALIRTLVGSLALLAAAAAGTPLLAAPVFTADQTTIALPPGKNEGLITLVVSGTGLAPNGPRELKAEDLGSGPPTITYATKLADSGTDYALWRIDGTVSGLPSDSVQTRRLLLKLADASGSIPLTVKNTPTGDFSWTVQGLSAGSKRRWTSADNINFSVQVGPVPARNVRLVQSDLIAADGSVLPPAFKLCDRDLPHCDGKALTLSANDSHPLQLKPTGAGAGAGIGQYSGNLLLVADEKPLGEALPLTLVVSDDKWRAVGAGLLVLGTLLAFLINPVLRAKIARAQARRPAALLREQAADLQNEIQILEVRTKTKLDHAGSLAGRVIERLDDSTLRKLGFIPGRVPIFYAPAAAGPAAGTYQDLLTESAKRLNSIAYVLNDGVRAVLALPGAETQETLVAEAVVQLDDLLDSTVELNAALIAAVKKVVDDCHKKLKALRVATTKSLTADGRRDLSVRQIDVELTELNLIGWLGFSILSILIGYIVLIAPNPAFGSWQDLVTCALWGFGLPAAGQQLTALGPGSATSSLGVNLLR